MTEAELFDALDGLYAYDTGCISSGIQDEHLRRRVLSHLYTLSPEAERHTLSTYIREHYLTDDALAQGYGHEDVREFLQWLEDQPWPTDLTHHDSEHAG